MKVFLTSLAYLLPALVIATGCGNGEKPREYQLPSKQEVVESIRRVNGQWQQGHPQHGDAFWHRAAYHVGNMAAYGVTADTAYLHYSEAWANHNEWKGARSDDRSEWIYSYGETDRYVLFGDWQTCFQVYAELYKLEPEPYKIARALEVMEYQMSTPQDDYIWWADGIFMVMPSMTKLYKITGDPLYLSKMYEYFAFARRLMWDDESSLFYRDAKYIYPAHSTDDGIKDFWARGNGWVIAAMARVLEDLPADDPHRDEYVEILVSMAGALKECQQEEGYWTRSMLDPNYAPGPETSGTAFFCYGLLWGMNNGVLDTDTYLPVALKAWDFMTGTAIQPDGRLGYVQPIGEKAIPGQQLNGNSTADFGVGAFLLAASEMVKYVSAN